MFTFQKTKNSLTVVQIVDGKATRSTIQSSHPNWNKSIEALKNNDEEALITAMSVKRTIEKEFDGEVKVIGNNVVHNGVNLHGLDVQCIQEFIKEGISFEPIRLFIGKKLKNPNKDSIEDLYRFLDNQQMTLTPEGNILGYKGVRGDFWSKHNNLDIKPIQGKSDESGHLFNGVGEVVEIDRALVTDRHNSCGPGLHVGSLSYATSWAGSDGKVVIVEFDPADVCSVPLSEHEKLRVCKYKVVGICSGELPKGYSNQYSTKVETIDPKNHEDEIEEDYSDENECDCEYCSEWETEEPPFPSTVDIMDQVLEKITPPMTNPCSEVPLNKTEPYYPNNSEYSSGYDKGLADGKHHAKRVYKVNDGNKNDYGRGYCDGYSYARKNRKN